MAISTFENTIIKFTIDAVGSLLSAQSMGQNVVACDYNGKKLSFSLLYDKREQMLTLQAAAELNDNIAVVIMPHRIELYVNERLADEEWPFGDHYLARADWLENETDTSVEEWKVPEKTEPSVIGTFQNAEGWQPEPEIFVGDCMPYYNEGRYHVLYLKDRHHHTSKWHLGAHQWAHISTDDFLNWQIHPLAVEITEPWEGSICTGSWIKKGDKQYLFYTVRTCDQSPAPLRRSVSTDGYHFTKDPDFSFTISKKYHQASARDPKVILGVDGRYHMFLTTSLAENNLGCLAHLVSDDMDNWEEMPEPIYVSPDNDQPECPDYFTLNGWYYLIFSHRSHGQYLYSDQPFGNWRKAKDNTIYCKSVPKMALWNDEIIFSGFYGENHYAGTLTFMHARQEANGELSFWKCGENKI